MAKKNSRTKSFKNKVKEQSHVKIKDVVQPEDVKLKTTNKKLNGKKVEPPDQLKEPNVRKIKPPAEVQIPTSKEVEEIISQEQEFPDTFKIMDLELPGYMLNSDIIKKLYEKSKICKLSNKQYLTVKCIAFKDFDVKLEEFKLTRVIRFKSFDKVKNRYHYIFIKGDDMYDNMVLDDKDNTPLLDLYMADNEYKIHDNIPNDLLGYFISVFYKDYRKIMDYDICTYPPYPVIRNILINSITLNKDFNIIRRKMDECFKPTKYSKYTCFYEWKSKTRQGPSIILK